MLTKRVFLGLTLVAGMVLLASVISARSSWMADDQRGQALEGTWIVTISAPGLTSFQVIQTYSPGGGFIETTTERSPRFQTMGHGAWERTGDREFASTFIRYLYDEAGSFSGTLKVWEVKRLNASLDEMDAVGRYEISDARGNVVTAGYSTGEGRRMKVEPLPF